MDFPSSLPPSLFMTGPLGQSDVPDLSFMCSWRDALTLPASSPQGSQDRAPPVAKDLLWEPDTPGPLPLLPPGPDPWDPGLTAKDLLFRGGYQFRRHPRAVLDVTEQVSRFLWNHGDIAFAPLGRLLLENFKLEGAHSRSKTKTVVSVKRLLQDLGGHQPWGCPWAYLSQRQRRFSILGAPILSTSVASLLGELLHEELALRWEQLLLDDVYTGGALAWVPGRTHGAGQLVYPVGSTMDTLRILPRWAQARDGQGVVGLEWPESINLSLARCPGFQKVSLTPESEPQVLRDPGRIQLRGPVRQVVTRSVQGEALLAVRSDHHCALWKVSTQGQPAPLQVLQVDKGATGISLSPHLPGEMVICSRSGAVCLWSTEDGLRQIYKDPETLVFRDPSPWRWADFTAHPRVLTVGDRTGVKMVDTQGPPGCGLLLFRGGAEASCQKGERVLLTQHLGDLGPESLHPMLHLVCTQFSVYLVDERLPLVPLFKWNHGLRSAPLLARLLPPLRPGLPQPLLLASQGGELQLLHLAGAGASTPRLAGLPQSLPTRSDSLSAFPLLEPKSHRRLQERLKAPTIGLAAVIPPPASTPVLSLFQLSAAGDVFYQHLHLQADPGPNAHAPAASWTPQATACCSRWLKALLEVPLAPPVWAAPTFSHRRLLGGFEPQKVEGPVPEGLRRAMAQGRLLQQRDLGLVPPEERPPAPEPGPEDELSERLEAAWEFGAAAWWERRRGSRAGPGKQPKRQKRRTQLSSTFSSLSGRVDLSDAASPPPSPDRMVPEARPQPPRTPPSQELTQEPWAQGVPSERQQTLRDYMAELPLHADTPGGASTLSSQTPSVQATPLGQHTPQVGTFQQLPRGDTPEGATLPSSQTPSIRATPSRQHTPQDSMVQQLPQGDTPEGATPPSSQTPSILATRSGSQRLRKKPRMGF
ncbi:TATA box-binding protein-associated factor RNA polymerase I subunit C isoform X1 [Cervus elaphus]|uniref:TATA box-binding protein-associated factor RNA polymerase I subunit C isoform X1 n=1 Tax=Cervus elaphus TaxID=9860 RepID=UPI001CC28826|nr:TATA box-binding protein-associated factor RNA polymerase I subunit C isoform X1 [Cervus elaphus]XP_043754109.1 TATA box-binding protein-associated factor RNA polymerase I subunit C isoform X1 [Cervus elaphus]